MADIVQMSDVASEEARSIPLECILCPKKPRFSDVSHLLTHVSSKSHLHHKFTSEFQAKSDSNVNERLGRYEQWYIENGIEGLLRERLSAKDQKKVVKRGRPSAVGVSSKPTEIRGSTTTDEYSKRKARVSPQTAQSIKTEPYDARPAALPHMGHWSTLPHEHSFHMHGARHDLFFDDSIYHTPGIKRGPSPYGYSELSDDQFHPKYESSRSETDTTESAIPSDVATVATATTTEGGDEEGHQAKLKGTVWPGMALFDSATPDQKRKRNQRKDSSVLEHMKLTSEAVTATECIWDPEGELQKERDIYASPSIDGSPVGSSPRKRKYRTRRQGPIESDAVDAQKDRTEVENHKKKRTRRAPLTDVTNVRQTRASTKNGGRAKKIGTGGKSDAPVKLSDIEDAKLPIGKNCGGNDSFDVFRDAPEPSPDRTESPLDDIHNNSYDLSHRPTALQPMNPNMILASPTPLLKQQPVRFFSGGIETPQLAYRQPPATYTPGYLQSQHSLPYNPLCSQPRGGLSYNHYPSSLFDDSKTPTTSFQPINSRLDFGNFNLNPNTNPYSNSNQRDTTGFNI